MGGEKKFEALHLASETFRKASRATKKRRKKSRSFEKKKRGRNKNLPSASTPFIRPPLRFRDPWTFLFERIRAPFSLENENERDD